MRYFIEFAYKGTNYHGWQYQPNATSVQETLTKALSTILKTEIELVGAGRTDAGVHAKQMFAHFDYDLEIDVKHLIHKINSFLPKDISVLDFHKVHNDAHARFDATKRTYEYHIHTKKDAFESDNSWYYQNDLNIEKMNEACKILFNHIDFECFSKVNTDVNTFNCKIYEAHWKQIDNRLIFTISADRFLRNMVRAIVGTMVNIGLEKVSLTDFTKIIESKDRNKAGFSVPAHGLFLTKVVYPYLEISG
ncbi:tRNA pseudouridine(38-40) synthase TruA [Flavobacterium sp. SUN052]|uniref:tRNA pseudouridine(38-40) synthase TruA n=1 Tax=Flavobacterium sp. SUN052 TaxID=3002441 RepID=UPI00237EDC2C|nr:tRNA pseudouridine(38-40) synthase TruA [Flavobacterium sp. SUN052]MEC4005936.1 tRNA pseudouridine(38-40) synthase TruA [Flavobacterium sp. SUN052]